MKDVQSKTLIGGKKFWTAFRDQKAHKNMQIGSCNVASGAALNWDLSF